jgi:hypothetical protein
MQKAEKYVIQQETNQALLSIRAAELGEFHYKYHYI